MLFNGLEKSRGLARLELPVSKKIETQIFETFGRSNITAYIFLYIPIRVSEIWVTSDGIECTSQETCPGGH